jgi:hypothetical protein
MLVSIQHSAFPALSRLAIGVDTTNDASIRFFDDAVIQKSMAFFVYET